MSKRRASRYVRDRDEPYFVWGAYLREWVHVLLVRFLFVCCTLSAFSLFFLLGFSTWLQPLTTDESLWYRVLEAFAHDSTLRRTTVFSALGLLCTAWIFFRRPRRGSRLSRREFGSGRSLNIGA